MRIKPERTTYDQRLGALAPDSHLPAAVRERISQVGNDVNLPAFVRAVLIALVRCLEVPQTRVRLAEVQAWLGVHRKLWLSERTIKAAVSILVSDHGIPIGSSRATGAAQQGYYFITTPAEAEAAVKPLVAEAKSLLRRCSLLSPTRTFFRRMVGQLEVKF